MTPKRLLAKGLILGTLVTACGWLPELSENAGAILPDPKLTGTPTSCPPATTPERGMPAEASLVKADLAQRGVNVKQVSAIGFVMCPPYSQKPKAVSWLTIEVTVDDLGNREAIGQMMEKVLAMLEKWPAVQVNMILYEATGTSTPARHTFSFTKTQIDDVRQRDLKGAALLDALGY
jgi:hypothetical protein